MSNSLSPSSPHFLQRRKYYDAARLLSPPLLFLIISMLSLTSSSSFRAGILRYSVFIQSRPLSWTPASLYSPYWVSLSLFKFNVSKSRITYLIFQTPDCLPYCPSSSAWHLCEPSYLRQNLKTISPSVSLTSLALHLLLNFTHNDHVITDSLFHVLLFQQLLVLWACVQTLPSPIHPSCHLGIAIIKPIILESLSPTGLHIVYKFLYYLPILSFSPHCFTLFPIISLQHFPKDSCLPTPAPFLCTCCPFCLEFPSPSYFPSEIIH